MAVGVFELGGVEADGVVLHHLEGALGYAFHFEEPLGAELGLDDGVGALAVAHLVGVVLYLLDEAGLLQVFDNLLTAGEAVHAGVFAAMLVEGAVVVEDVDGLEVVFHAQIVVVDVVGGSNLQGAGTELAVHVFVHDDGHHATHAGHDDFLALEPLVALVLGVHAHGGVAHDGLGTGGGNDDVVLSGYTGISGNSGVFNIVAEVEQFAMAFLVDDLLVADGCQGLGVPVDHAHAAVDEAFVVEVHEDADDALVAHLVHSECRAVPVAACTQFAQLFQDDAAVLLFPFPGVFHEFVAAERPFVDTAVGEHLDDLGLGGDAGVVGAGHPAGVLALHAGAAHQHVLNGVVEHVAHVEHSRHVGRRNHHGVGHAVVGLRVEEFLVKPELIPFLLYLPRVVLRC